MKRLIVIIGVLIMSIVLAGVSYGATATGDILVRATVVSACTLSTTSINFGNVVSGDFYFASGSITVNCSLDVPYDITLDAGTHYDAVSGVRTLTSGSYVSYYSLYKDAGTTQQWGDSDYANTYPDGSSLHDTGNSSNQNHTVYGALTTVGSAPAGTVLTDTVTVTVHY